jgi:sigma-B regulation protein RsbU (phosphoserine phosphatase)
MIYRGSSRSVEEFAPEGGPPLGLVADVVYKDASGSCQAGDKMLLYTDGISEARQGREEFGIDRLKSCFQEMGAWTGREAVGHIAKAVVKFQAGSPQHDDVTMLVVDF